MRKLLISILFLLVFVVNANAQYASFRSFKLDFGAMLASSGGDVFGSGFGFYVNPKYCVANRVWIGIRYQGLITSYVESYIYVSMISSKSLSLDYYLNDNKFRPFIGVDFGSYSLGSVSFGVPYFGFDDSIISDVYVNGIKPIVSSVKMPRVKIGSSMGFAPKFGFSHRHVDMSIQYNFILPSDGIISASEFNFLSFNLGFHFGGGRK